MERTDLERNEILINRLFAIEQMTTIAEKDISNLGESELRKVLKVIHLISIGQGDNIGVPKRCKQKSL